MSYLFALSYYPWVSQSKNTDMVWYSLFQWTTFCQNSPPWPVCLGDLTRHGYFRGREEYSWWVLILNLWKNENWLRIYCNPVIRKQCFQDFVDTKPFFFFFLVFVNCTKNHNPYVSFTANIFGEICPVFSNFLNCPLLICGRCAAPSSCLCIK